MVALIKQEGDPYRDVKNETVDEMNQRLVLLCQHILERTVGESPPYLGQDCLARTSSLLQEQTLAASIHLYKQAYLVSKENDVIMPTASARGRGIDALTENLQILQRR